ncbi:hypothetical protein BOFL111202_22640 [Bordetella flabilis]
MHQADAQVRQVRAHRFVGVHRRLQLQRFAFLHQRAHPICLAAAAHGLCDMRDDLVAPDIGHQLGDDGGAAWRQFVDDGHVQVGEEGHGERARNGRRAHVQLMRHHAAARGFALARQGQALPDPEAVLFVHDGQAQPFEGHMVLDQGLRADHQPHAAIGHRRGSFAPRLRAQAAAQPGHPYAQRFQPVDQLAEMLLGQDLRRRHHRDLYARLHGLRRGDGGHHRLAAPDIALQQAMHGKRPRQVGADFLHHARLRGRQGERQRAIQARHQAVGVLRPRQRQGLVRASCGTRGSQGQLLRQQLVELDTAPGGVRTLDQFVFGHAGRRGVQDAYGLVEGGQVVAFAHRRGQRIGQVRLGQRLRDGFAQYRLMQPFRSGIDGRKRGGQRRIGAGHAWMHHLAPEQAAAHFAARPQPASHGQLALLAGIEVEPAQLQLAGLVGDGGRQLLARTVLHLATRDFALHLRGVTRPQRGNRRHPGFVLVAQGQMQDEVGRLHQAQRLQPALGIAARCRGLGRHGGARFTGGHGGRHGD